MNEPQKEMPVYDCHKQVWALKIKEISYADGRNSDGSATITPEEDGYAPFDVNAEYIAKHSPQRGGYYVVYKGGYKSFSPADVFEDGYTISGDK